MHCFLFVVAAIFMAVADLVAQDLAGSESDNSPAPAPISVPNIINSVAITDFRNRWPTDSTLVTPYDAGSFETSTSNPQDSESTQYDYQNKLLDGLNDGENINILGNRCAIDRSQTNGRFRKRQENCQVLDNANQINYDDPQVRADLEDAAYAKEHAGDDVDARNICDLNHNIRKIPLCCRGREYIVLEIKYVKDCVVYIEGRPRCRNYRQRYCCRRFGGGWQTRTSGTDCAAMFEPV